MAQGNTGEIYVKSNSLMQGYYNNSALTAERFSDGWLKTGDIGYVDKDNEVLYWEEKTISLTVPAITLIHAG